MTSELLLPNDTRARHQMFRELGATTTPAGEDRLPGADEEDPPSVRPADKLPPLTQTPAQGTTP